MAITVAEKKAIIGFASFVVGVLFLRRAFGKGDVFIDRVQVQKADWSAKDAEDAILSALQRQAMEDLGVDLDLMEPTKAPTPLQTLEVEQTIGKLRKAGKTSEANFLATLLHQAQSLGGSSA